MRERSVAQGSGRGFLRGGVAREGAKGGGATFKGAWLWEGRRGGSEGAGLPV